VPGLNTGPTTAGIPAYFHPAIAADDWATLAQAHPAVRAVVLNVADGPGITIDMALFDAAARAREAGVPVLGYVDTDYADRPIASIEAELRRYRSWYGTSGFFLDQAATDPAHLDFYQRLSRLARAAGDTIVLNPGAHPDPAYLELADAIVTFEGPWSAYERSFVPEWVWQWSAERFWHLVYDAPEAALGPALALAAQRNAGTVYITDGAGTNPWHGLPSYFGHQLAALAGDGRR
jgi:hypothetical protein